MQGGTPEDCKARSSPHFLLALATDRRQHFHRDYFPSRPAGLRRPGKRGSQLAAPWAAAVSTSTRLLSASPPTSPTLTPGHQAPGDFPRGRTCREGSWKQGQGHLCSVTCLQAGDPGVGFGVRGVSTSKAAVTNYCELGAQTAGVCSPRRPGSRNPRPAVGSRARALRWAPGLHHSRLCPSSQALFLLCLPSSHRDTYRWI